MREAGWGVASPFTTAPSHGAPQSQAEGLIMAEGGYRESHLPVPFLLSPHPRLAASLHQGFFHSVGSSSECFKMHTITTIIEETRYTVWL